jgi:hypothetical protein
MNDAALRRNVALYPWYRAAGDALAWMPVFFLYFNAHLPLREVLWLEAAYYLAVVIAELPSGYLSDRLGRRPVLVMATLALLGAYVFFILGGAFEVFLCAQVLLAVAIAFRSGSDTTLHFESLAALGREADYGRREGRAERFGLTASALAALAGGALGLFDLRLAYGLSLLAALAALLLLLRCVEPQGRPDRAHPALAFHRHLAACVGALKDPLLAWLFGFFVLHYALAHVPYEFYQAYLKLLGSAYAGAQLPPPLASGLLLAATMLLAAWAAGRAIAWRDSLGLARLLIVVLLLQVLLLLALGWALHPFLVLIVLLRGLPMALSRAPLRAAIAPRIPRAQRATYLSLQSLAGRLGFSGYLFALSLAITPTPQLAWPQLAAILQTSALIGLAGLLVLLLLVRPLRGAGPG